MKASRLVVYDAAKAASQYRFKVKTNHSQSCCQSVIVVAPGTAQVLV